MGKRLSKFFIIIGLVLISTALCLTLYNLWTAQRASKQAEVITSQILEQMENIDDFDFQFSPKTKMPTTDIDGYDYIGTLKIPALGLNLPVMSTWDYPKLRISPCRYKGSVYAGDMIIAGHNYSGHFGRIGQLNPGDEVIFTDMNKKQFEYSVVTTEQLRPADIEEMESGDWDLTLFTCSMGTQYRITVRCEKTGF